MASKARVKIIDGERWFSEKDFRKCLRDNELMKKALAMLYVSHREKGDSPEVAMRTAIACFYCEATGALSHQDN